jgi:hypothetical protein
VRLFSSLGLVYIDNSEVYTVGLHLKRLHRNVIL